MLVLPNEITEESTDEDCSANQNEQGFDIATGSTLTEHIGTVSLVLSSEYHVDPFRIVKIYLCHCILSF